MSNPTPSYTDMVYIIAGIGNGVKKAFLCYADALTFNKTATKIPFDPDSTKFPTRKELPGIPGAPPGAAWVWGKDDNLGRLNLLTPRRVAAAAAEIRTGEIINLDLPLDVPKQPAFGREIFHHEIKTIAKDLAYDDKYSMNTQSGTQWDGFRHIAYFGTSEFYNGVRGKDIEGPDANLRDSIHHWADHGIAGRGILLDYRSYAKSKGIVYDPYDRHAITYAELQACGAAQGIDIRPASAGGSIQIGDLLFIRAGFVEAYHSKPADERAALALRPHVHGPDDPQRWAGLSQEDEIIDWLHDCYFAAVAGDSPTFEAWPSQRERYLHEYILALWGMPLGEMFDLEKLAATCREKNRWTFFVTSSPANCHGGISSHANAQAIF